MGVEVAGCCLQQLLPPCNTCSSKTIDAVFMSISAAASSSPNKRRGFADQTGHRSLSLGARRSQSLDIVNGRGVRGRCRDHHALTRAISATFQTFPTDDNEDDNDKELELLNQLRELSNKVHQQSISTTADSETISASRIERGGQDDAAPIRPSFSHSTEPPWPAIGSESQKCPDLFPESLERKANSIDLPLSLRMIKKKKMQDHSLISEAASETPSSVNMAFSSMVFMIRELQRYALQMREFLFLENLQGVLTRAHAEMHASFVWLFQQIFSCTPTLMLSLMLLLANFTVYSMAASAIPPAATAPQVVVSVVVVEVDNHYNQFYPFNTKTISLEDDGRAASIGGGGGIGGGKERPIGGATDDARPYYQSVTSPSSYESTEEELRLWSGIVDEASRMQAVWRDDVLMDPNTLQRFVSPVSVELPPEDQTAYLQTEAMYHKALSQEPNNSILLCNFAQFLYLVLHDHDRAEYYFKRAIQAEPIDAESMSRYANFLWIAKNDIGAAEETFLEAIAADPGNTYYAGNYAHFLWSTGGEETCYPLD